MTTRLSRSVTSTALVLFTGSTILLSACSVAPPNSSIAGHPTSSPSPSVVDDDISDDDDFDDDDDDDDDDGGDDDDDDDGGDDDDDDDDPDGDDDVPDELSSPNSSTLVCVSPPASLEDFLAPAFSLAIDEIASVEVDDETYYIAVDLEDSTIAILLTDEDPGDPNFDGELHAANDEARRSSTYEVATSTISSAISARLTECL